MLTKVYLEGPMGKQFGREWEFELSSPTEALRMVDANCPGVFIWIKQNLENFPQYRVVCSYENGVTEELDENTYQMNGVIKEIRYVPLIEGAGGVGKMIMGVVLIVAGVVFQQPWMVNIGVSMMISGAIELLTPKPNLDKMEQKENKNKTSYFFDGPVNTTMQGVPVQLVYGRMLIGSHVISAGMSVDQLL